MTSFKRLFLLCLSTLLIASTPISSKLNQAIEAQAGIHRIGIFPDWLSLHPDIPLASEELVTSWAATLLSDLQRYEACEWLPLHLPEFFDDEKQTNFDTFIGKGLFREKP